MRCDQNWRSVRKIRYLEDIITTIEYSINNSGKKFDKLKLYEKIIESRYERINLIQKHHQSSSRSKRSLYKTKFSFTLPDSLVFFREVQIFIIDNNEFLLKGELSEEYQNRPFDDKRSLILKYILESKYNAYICYLKRLYTSDILIPKAFQKRDSRTREYINNKQILTDVPSFYTLRDIFYEFNLNNWFINKSNELIIYPTYSITKKPDKLYNNYIKIKDKYININKKMENESFLDILVESYLEKSSRRYEQNLDLMPIRDDVCYKLKISDFEFKRIINDVSSKKNEIFKISLNFGYKTSKLRNYDLKLVTLPKVSSNRLAMYIKIDKVR